MKFRAIRVLQLSAAALLAGALAYGGAASAQEKKPKAKAPACNSLKVEADCTRRDDCTWRSASVDAKTGKEKRRASCAAKPKPAKKKTT